MKTKDIWYHLWFWRMTNFLKNLVEMQMKVEYIIKNW